MRIGVFGGSFDPPHLGHLILASEAQSQLDLDRVLWVITGQSPFKIDQQVTDSEVRVSLVAAAIAGNESFKISRVDLDRPAPHFTFETIKILRTQHPGAQLHFLMGADSLHDFPDWREPSVILDHCRLAVLRRPGVQVNMTTLEEIFPGISAKVDWVITPQLEISSRDLRRRLQAGNGIRYFVSESVQALIERNALYRPQAVD